MHEALLIFITFIIKLTIFSDKIARVFYLFIVERFIIHLKLNIRKHNIIAYKVAKTARYSKEPPKIEKKMLK